MVRFNKHKKRIVRLDLKPETIFIKRFFLNRLDGYKLIHVWSKVM